MDVCPEGWHLPSKTEWNTLFSALPAGSRDDYGCYASEGNYAYFWSSTENESSVAYCMLLDYYDDYATLSYSTKNPGFSVRCLKDWQVEGRILLDFHFFRPGVLGVAAIAVHSGFIASR